MVKKLSILEKELIKLNVDRIKEEHSFNKKVFFTITGIIVGSAALYFKINPNLNKGIIAGILFSMLLFMMESTFTISDLRREYDELCKRILKSRNLDDYIPEKTKPLRKIITGLQFGFILFLMFFILSDNITWSLLFGLILLIITFFSPRYF